MEGGANSFWLFLIDHTFYNSQCTYLTKDLWGAEQPVCCYFSATLSSINLLIVILFSVSQMYHSLSYLMSLHLLFPLPGVLCLQIIEWFHLCFIQVSAYMLSSLERPSFCQLSSFLERPSFPYLSSFFCIAISYHIILSLLYIVCLTPYSASSRGRNFSSSFLSL